MLLIRLLDEDNNDIYPIAFLLCTNVHAKSDIFLLCHIYFFFFFFSYAHLPFLDYVDKCRLKYLKVTAEHLNRARVKNLNFGLGLMTKM